MLFTLLYVKYRKNYNSKYIITDILQIGSTLRVSSRYPIQIYLFVALLGPSILPEMSFHSNR